MKCVINKELSLLDADYSKLSPTEQRCVDMEREQRRRKKNDNNK